MTRASDIPALPGRDPSVWEKDRLTKKHASNILDTIGAFYAWEPKLAPLLPDLEQRTRRAIWWRAYQSEMTELGVGSRGLAGSDRSLLDGYGRPIAGVRTFTSGPAQHLSASLWDSLSASLWASLWASLNDSLNDSLWASLRASLMAPLRASLMAPLRASLSASLWASLSASVFWTIKERRLVVEFQPLLDLWLAGNYPVGFDKDDNLLVLVADAPATKLPRRPRRS